MEPPPLTLSKAVNPCSIDVGTFKRAMRRASSNQVIFDTVGYTVVASCGNQTKVFQIPYVDTLNLKRLRQISKIAADLVNLYSQMVQQLFPDEPINGMTNPKDYELRIVGEAFVSELARLLCLN